MAAPFGGYAFLGGVFSLVLVGYLYSTRSLRLEESERLAEYLRGRGWRDVSPYTAPPGTWKLALPRSCPRLTLTERRRSPLLPPHETVYVPAWVAVWVVLARALLEASVDALFHDHLPDLPITRELREATRRAETTYLSQRGASVRLAWWSYRHAEDAIALLDLGGESAVKAMYDAR